MEERTRTFILRFEVVFSLCNYLMPGPVLKTFRHRAKYIKYFNYTNFKIEALDRGKLYTFLSRTFFYDFKDLSSFYFGNYTGLYYRFSRISLLLNYTLDKPLFVQSTEKLFRHKNDFLLMMLMRCVRIAVSI